MNIESFALLRGSVALAAHASASTKVSRTQARWAMSAAIVLCALTVGEAQAQTQSTTDNDAIIVTGQREEEPVAAAASRLGLTPREVPATVEIVDSETIRERGYSSVIDTVKSAAGVTAADTATHVPFTMRGFQMAQVSVTYNGINLGSNDFTGLNMGTFNLDRVEFLKGPSSIISGQGSVGGTINFVTKAPHTGPITSEIFLQADHRGSFRSGFGSGGSTGVADLDYRFDISRSDDQSFIVDSEVEYVHISGGLDYQLSPSLKLFVAAEYKDLSGEVYVGTPLVPIAFSGSFATSGIVRGTSVSSFNGTDLGAVTVDRRTLKTNYNVLDDRKVIDETWVRAGLEWNAGSDLALRSHFYSYDAHRSWRNNEITAFNARTGLVDRERFFVEHDQKILGNNTDLTWKTRAFGFDNQLVVGVEYYDLDFVRPGAANFPSDSVSLVDFARGTYGLLTTAVQTAKMESVAVNLEDRLKITPTFALVGGLRYNAFSVDRTSADVAGVIRPGFPLSESWDPVTGRIGFTWDVVPEVTFYGQYATASDIAVGSYFLLGPTERMELSKARSYETGLKASLWEGRAQATLSLFDIRRSNIYSAIAGRELNLAGALDSRGVEFTAAVRPVPALSIWANASYVHARYDNYEATGVSFSGNTPPNIPSAVVNAGASYRFDNPILPVELGASISHVGDRYTTDENTVTMPAYTTADLFAFVDLQKGLSLPTNTRLTFRVKNVTNERYAVYGDPFYPDQIFLGTPRTYEVSTSFRF